MYYWVHVCFGLLLLYGELWMTCLFIAYYPFSWMRNALDLVTFELGSSDISMGLSNYFYRVFFFLNKIQSFYMIQYWIAFTCVFVWSLPYPNDSLGVEGTIASSASLGPEHTGHFVQPHVAAHCGGPEHTRTTCGGDMYVMYANALSVAGTSHSLSHTWATNCSVLAKAWK